MIAYWNILKWHYVVVDVLKTYIAGTMPVPDVFVQLQSSTPVF